MAQPCCTALETTLVKRILFLPPGTRFPLTEQITQYDLNLAVALEGALLWECQMH